MSETVMRAMRRNIATPVRLFKEATALVRSARVVVTPAPAAAPAPAPAVEQASTPPTPAPSIISAKAVVTGSIQTPEELHVHGRVDGDIDAARIIVCPGGAVKGGLSARTIIVHGAVEGQMDAECVLLCANAVVAGDITHRTLGVDTTASFEGSVKRLPPPVPAVRAAE